MKKILLSTAAAVVLLGCGGEEAKGQNPAGDVAVSKSVETASPIDKPFVLKGAEPLDIEAFFELFPQEARPSYENAVFDPQIGATVLKGIVYKDENDASLLTIDRAELYGVDLEAIARVWDKIDSKASADIDAPYEQLSQKIRLFGVKAPQEETGETADGAPQEFSIEGVELSGLRFRASSLGDNEKAPLYFLNALDLKGAYLKNLQIAAQDENGGTIAVSAPDWRLEGFGGGKLDFLTARDFSYAISQSKEALTMLEGVSEALTQSPVGAALFSGATQKVEASSFEWKGLDLSGLLEHGLKGEEPAADAKDLIQLGAINIADAKTYIDDKLFSKVSEAQITATQSTWLIPSKIKASSKALYDFSAYAPQTEEALLTVIKEHGLDAVEATSDVIWDWNGKSGKANFVTKSTSKDFADFEMLFDLVGFKSEALKAEFESDDASEFSSSFKLETFKANLKDKKLLDAIFAIAGLQMNSSGADLRQSAPAMIRLVGIQAASVNPLYGDYVNAAADFISKGGSLDIDATPQKPVPFEDIAKTLETKPEGLAEVLGLSVTHKE